MDTLIALLSDEETEAGKGHLLKFAQLICDGAVTAS